MRDVAAAAGVSLSTVSLVLNGKSGVAPARRERVLKAMKDLGYIASSRQNLAAGTRVLGLLMESLSEASRSEGFYTRIVSGIEDTAYELGYQVLLHVYRPDVDPLNSLRELMGRDIDGLIVANDGDVTPQVIQKITNVGVPIVLIENYQSFPIHSLTADNFTAGRMMTEYLIGLGHRRIGGIGGPLKYSSLRDRMRGHRVALLEHGIDIDPALQPPPVSGNPRKGYVQMQQLLALPEPPTAVFAVSDRAAFGAMDAIKDAGLRVPEDISVVGIDDVRDSAFSTPPLTTFSVPKYELGRSAVYMLHDLIHGKAIPPCRMVLLGNLVERRSACAPRA
ncbi:transcriptional regulator, LacI family [Anaerolinea thermolimosa]|uniref:LacI family DNA-binding transcriptional regulator n=1 Tax=Anaerolinea thermolimosa TaxID=229919 RepID=UPI0013B3BDAE|nr:substrate-binding domain-containing protein [Anaerolinea thermolimosa]GAP06396.1 transcriptional regulator, LacI family [Anaerolinea thermolimosa]